MANIGIQTDRDRTLAMAQPHGARELPEVSAAIRDSGFRGRDGRR